MTTEHLTDSPPAAWDEDGRQPPHNPSAERAVLGAILLSPNAFHDVSTLLEPADFYLPAHELIYDAAWQLYGEGAPVEALTVAEHLQASGNLARAGGAPALHALISDVASPAAGAYYAGIVAQYATRRRIAAAAQRIQQLAHGNTAANPAELARAATAALTAATADSVDQHPVRAQNVDEFLAGQDDDVFDWLVPGFLERGDRLILTAGEGHGKSTLLRQWWIQIAAGINPITLGPMPAKRTLLVDLENSSRQSRRKARPLRLAAGDRLNPTHAHIFCKVDGLDLTRPEDELWLTNLVAAHNIDLLITGPIYKLAAGNPNEEKEAKPAAMALDRIRAQHDCAVILEAHTAKSPAGTPPKNRPKEPFGWSGWLRWPEFGIHLSEDGTITHWRGARDEREIPEALNRGGTWPWTPNTTAAPGETQVRWQQISRAYIHAGRRLPMRELVEATGIPRSTIQRILAAYESEHAQLLAHLRAGGTTLPI